jgi:hypothetical protein
MLANCRIPQRGEITPQPEARRSSSRSTYPVLITILSTRVYCLARQSSARDELAKRAALARAARNRSEQHGRPVKTFRGQIECSNVCRASSHCCDSAHVFVYRTPISPS